ncbi:MAG: ParB/RepB/Spo0J family partition protein [Anaerorhabdus sp.]
MDNILEGIMNDASKEKVASKIMEIQLDEITPNENNKAPLVEIEELMSSIERVGLRNPIVVYKEANHDYKLLSGERRYTAFCNLKISAIPSIIVPKPADEIAEREFILDANSQREDTKEYRFARVKEYEQIYFLKKEAGVLPVGLLKQDYIGQQMSLSGKQIQRLLKEAKETENLHGHDVHVNEKKEVTAKQVVKKLIKIAEMMEEISWADGDKDSIFEAIEAIESAIDK